VDRTAHPLVSFVVPVFNEETSVVPFVDALAKAMRPTGCRYEIVFVNDGCTDGTLAALRKIKGWNPAVVIVSLSRNFGKEAALTAGIDLAKGDVVVPIDVDLQDPPELIEPFLACWREGADIVYGVRSTRTSDSWVKRRTAEAFYKLFNAVSSVPIPRNAGDFRLIDRQVVEQIKRLKERTRFMKGLMAWPGFRTECVAYDRASRLAGKSSWNYWRLWNFAMDGITSFSTVPLRAALYVGAVISVLSFLYAGFIVVHALMTGGDVPGYPSLMVAVMFFGGIQLFSIGLVGEYVGRIFHEVKGRPIYVIDRIE
jgi:polyisoprenyl-phosphate glycosyltransferase